MAVFAAFVLASALANQKGSDHDRQHYGPHRAAVRQAAESAPGPGRAVDGGGGLGVDVALLRQVTGIRKEPPVLHGSDRDTAAW